MRLESKKEKKKEGEGGKEHSSVVRRLGVRIVSAEKYESYQAQTGNDAGEHRQEPHQIICTRLD